MDEILEKYLKEYKKNYKELYNFEITLDQEEGFIIGFQKAWEYLNDQNM
jgi:hypothetical protein